MTHPASINLTGIKQIGQVVMRPFALNDATRLQSMAGNWNVASMLARVPYPYPQDAAEQWIASHEEKFASGSDYPLAITLAGELVGSCGVARAQTKQVEKNQLNIGDENPWELGYWVGQDHWGKGIATDAARTLITFAFDQLKADEIAANHFTCNPGSGRVLTKCGFANTGETTIHCLARDETVPARTMTLSRATFAAPDK